MSRRVLIGPSVYYRTPGTPFLSMRKRRYSSPHLSNGARVPFLLKRKDLVGWTWSPSSVWPRAINFIKGKIDRRELEEGITWGELIVALQEKAKGEGEDNGTSWLDLLLLLFSERSFFGLKKDSGKCRLWRRGVRKKSWIISSKKARRSPILKSRNI